MQDGRHAKGHDQSVDAKRNDEAAGYEPDDRAQREDAENDRQGSLRVAIDDSGSERRQECDLGIDRQVYSASDYNHGLPERCERERSRLFEDVLEVLDRTKILLKKQPMTVSRTISPRTPSRAGFLRK